VTDADRAWSVTDTVDPASFFWDRLSAGYRNNLGDRHLGRAAPRHEEVPAPRPARLAPMPAESTPLEEVAEVLDWACTARVITVGDRDLLMCLLDAAGEVEPSRVNRSNSGLTSHDITLWAAPRCGLSQATVRRHAARSIRAIAAAADRYVA
jgi:hypothetical protein